LLLGAVCVFVLLGKGDHEGVHPIGRAGGADRVEMAGLFSLTAKPLVGISIRQAYEEHLPRQLAVPVLPWQPYRIDGEQLASLAMDLLEAKQELARLVNRRLVVNDDVDIMAWVTATIEAENQARAVMRDVDLRLDELGW